MAETIAIRPELYTLADLKQSETIRFVDVEVAPAFSHVVESMKAKNYHAGDTNFSLITCMMDIKDGIIIFYFRNKRMHVLPDLTL